MPARELFQIDYSATKIVKLDYLYVVCYFVSTIAERMRKQDAASVAGNNKLRCVHGSLLIRSCAKAGYFKVILTSLFSMRNYPTNLE